MRSIVFFVQNSLNESPAEMSNATAVPHPSPRWRRLATAQKASTLQERINKIYNGASSQQDRCCTEITSQVFLHQSISGGNYSLGPGEELEAERLGDAFSTVPRRSHQESADDEEVRIRHQHGAKQREVQDEGTGHRARIIHQTTHSDQTSSNSVSHQMGLMDKERFESFSHSTQPQFNTYQFIETQGSYSAELNLNEILKKGTISREQRMNRKNVLTLSDPQLAKRCKHPLLRLTE